MASLSCHSMKLLFTGVWEFAFSYSYMSTHMVLMRVIYMHRQGLTRYRWRNLESLTWSDCAVCCIIIALAEGVVSREICCSSAISLGGSGEKCRAWKGFWLCSEGSLGRWGGGWHGEVLKMCGRVGIIFAWGYKHTSPRLKANVIAITLSLQSDVNRIFQKSIPT